MSATDDDAPDVDDQIITCWCGAKGTYDELFDFEQAGERLNVSAATIRRMVAKGMLPSIAVSPSGKHRMIRVVDLEDYLSSQATVAREDDPARALTVPDRDFLRQAGWDGKIRG